MMFFYTTSKAPVPICCSIGCTGSTVYSRCGQCQSENGYFRTGDTTHAFLTIQFSVLIKVNRENLTRTSIRALFAAAGDDESRVNTV